MATVTSISYANSTAVTITLASLASGQFTARESTAVDNSTNLYDDAIVYGAFKLGSGTTANDKAIYLYFYGSENGTNFTWNASGTDAALTLSTPTNFAGPAVVSINSNPGSAVSIVVGSVASYFGGVLPRKWGVIVNNYTNLSLDATEANSSVSYSGIKYSAA